MALGATAAFVLATTLLTRQNQLPLLEGLAAPWALLLVVVGLRINPAIAVIGPMLFYAAASMVGSIFIGRDIATAGRFFAILVGTLLAFHVRLGRVSAPWALLPILVQSLLITALAITLAVLQDPLLAAGIRNTAIENNWGDVYSFDGLYFRVQVIGNALLPLLFMICLWRFGSSRFYSWGLYLSGVGLVAAGNLTYFVTIAFALLLRRRQLLSRSLLARVLAVVAALALLTFGWDLANTLIERKFEGSDSSMGVRFDQVGVAVKAFGESPMQMLLGAGLGARFPDGLERNYSESLYIELQALYITYQIGLLGMLIYILSLIYLVRQTLNRDGRPIFWLYILSGITNPYILDTNQLVATLILVHLFSRVHDSDHA